MDLVDIYDTIQCARTKHNQRCYVVGRQTRQPFFFMHLGTYSNAATKKELATTVAHHRHQLNTWPPSALYIHHLTRADTRSTCSLRCLNLAILTAKQYYTKRVEKSNQGRKALRVYAGQKTEQQKPQMLTGS